MDINTNMRRLLLLLLLSQALGGRAGGEVAQQDVFVGIEDQQASGVLRALEGKPGRWNIAPDEGRFLHDLVVKHKYRRALEIGTSNGYSSIWLGLALRKTGGKLITIEIDVDRAEEAKSNFRMAGLEKQIDLRLNDAFKEIPNIPGEFDFVFIDADRPDYKEFLDLLLPRVTIGGVITAHNVTSHPRPMRDFLQAIKTDKRLETTIRQTKSGISVSFRRRYKKRSCR